MEENVSFIQKQDDNRDIEMLLALSGGIFGVLGALFAVGIGELQRIAGVQAVYVAVFGWSAFLFAILGMLAAVVVLFRPRIAAFMLFVSALGGVAFISFFYIIPFVCMCIAGAMCLLRGTTKPVVTGPRPRMATPKPPTA